MTAPTTPSTALLVRGLKVSLGGQPVLHEVDLAVPTGRWVSIVGPNGAGKSTLLAALAGLLPAQGHISLLGQDVASMSPAYRARTLAWMGQNEPAGEDLRAWDVVLLGRLPHQGWLSGLQAQDLQVAEQALRSTQAWDWRERSMGTLSGGERQRVLLARALAVQAPVILLDEPLSHLDPPHQADWMDLTRALVAGGATVLSVLHEVSMALQADEMLILQNGRLVHQGACADPRTHRALEQVFDQRIAVHTLDGQALALPRRAASTQAQASA